MSKNGNPNYGMQPENFAQIKVVGVGGGGSNAVDRMIAERRCRLLEHSRSRVTVQHEEIEADRWQVVHAEVA